MSSLIILSRLDVLSHLSALLNLSMLFLIGCALKALLGFRKTGWFPIVGEYSDLLAALREGTERYPDKAFAIPTSPPLIILPRTSVKEIQALPEMKASAARELFRRAVGKYTKVGTNTIAGIKAIRTDLSRDIANTIPMLEEEYIYAFAQNIGTCEDWTPVPVSQRFCRIVALTSGRVFVGMPLCRNEEWIQLTVDWTFDLMRILHATARYPACIRSFIMPYLSETKRILNHRAKATKLLTPMFTAQLRARAQTKSTYDDNAHCDVTTWRRALHATVEGLVRNQLSISWAAIHTSTQHLSHAIFDLAARPEYQQPLLEESEAILRESGGKFRKEDMAKLKKLDSFMRESQRMNPSTLVGMMRLTTAPLALSTGQTVPAGTPIGIYSKGINESSTLYTSPDELDGCRFYKMRQREGQESLHQFVSTGPTESLDFGHGVHACPGRFFASTEIKIILAYMLQLYELKLKDGQNRPASVYNEIWVAPDPTAEILFKRRDRLL